MSAYGYGYRYGRIYASPSLYDTTPAQQTEKVCERIKYTAVPLTIKDKECVVAHVEAKSIPRYGVIVRSPDFIVFHQIRILYSDYNSSTFFKRGNAATLYVNCVEVDNMNKYVIVVSSNEWNDVERAILDYNTQVCGACPNKGKECVDIALDSSIFEWDPK